MIHRLGVLLVVLPVLATASAAQKAGAANQNAAKDLAARLKADPVAPLRMASLGGKYRMLLRQIKVAEPGKDLIVDRGFRHKTSYHGHKNLPSGHWVYVRPYWFIWRETTDVNLPKRKWGPEQMIGEPDAASGRDAPTAWATKAQNRAEIEWVMLDYKTPVKATEILIYETFNPGAVSRVSIFKHDGEELVVWRAKEVKLTGTASRVLKVQPPLGFHVSRVKVYLETSRVAGWNEIDAVGIVDDKGRKHWAIAAEASTTFAKVRTARAPMKRPAMARRPARKPAFPVHRLVPPAVIRRPPVAPVKRAAVAPSLPVGAARSADVKKLADHVARLAAENRALKARLARLEKLIEQLQARKKR